MANPVNGLLLRDGRVLVYQDVIKTSEKVSDAGIIQDLGLAPDTKASSGVVLNIAEGVEWTVGARVIFSPYSGFAMHYKGDARYLLLGGHEIFAQYEGDVGDVEIR